MDDLTAFSSSGIKDWFLQRCTALIIMFYYLFFMYVILSNKDTFSYNMWCSLFQSPWVKIFTILTFLSILIHIWIGLWTVLTDYVKNSLIFGFFQIFIILGNVISLFFFMLILF